MKYNVEDKVTYDNMSGVVTEVNESKRRDLKIEWSDGHHDWFPSGNLSTDYRALYERERALHEALVKYVEQSTKYPDAFSEQVELFDHYQQLKQQYGQNNPTTP